MILAGGAATRLGAEVPKGAFPLEAPGLNCLFEALLHRASAAGEPDVVIVLSSQTASTERFLQEKHFFGYPESKI